MTPQAEGPASQPREASGGHQMSIVVIGLAVVARILRDPRTHEAAIMAAVAVVAVAGLGKAGRAKSFARLAAWDKRHAAKRATQAQARHARQAKRLGNDGISG